MKTLIINGSPREKGDTAFLLNELKKYLKGEVIEISAYRNNIKPCTDCRHCWKENGCAIKDDMQIIYDGDYDNVVIASPIFMGRLTGPLCCLDDRLQALYAAKYIANKEIEIPLKKGILILVGGGHGNIKGAIEDARWMLRKLRAINDEELEVLSLNTDKLPTSQDIEAFQKIKIIGEKFK